MIPTSSRVQRRVAWAIFWVVSWAHFCSVVTTAFDSGWSIHLAVSFLRQGDFELSEYRDLVQPGDTRVQEVEGRMVSRYPVWPAVVAAPGVAVAKTMARRVLGVPLHTYLLNGGDPGGLEKLLSSLLVGLASVLIFRLARRELSLSGAVLTTFIFAFCTSAWSVVSRGLWQHAPSLVFVTAALAALSSEDPRRVARGGIWVAAAYAVRPTNALLVLAALVYVTWRHRSRLLPFLAWAAPVAVLFVGQSLWDYGTVLPPYSSPGQSGFGAPSWLEGLAGTLISPGRGLLLYSPVLLFGFWGVAQRWRHGDRVWVGALGAVLLAHWLLISTWFVWWGGMVYGPRLFADVLPIWMLFLMPPIGSLVDSWRQQPAHAVVLALLVGWSFWLHAIGANRWAAWDWNILPRDFESVAVRPEPWYDPEFRRPWDVDRNPERLWSIEDAPFTRRRTPLERGR